MIKVFIVDDHYMVVEGIRSLLANDKDIDFIGSASTIESCKAFLKSNQPDVILMDINLPDGNGIDLCAEVSKLYPGLHVLGLSTFTQESYIRKMMDNGAAGYILKNSTQSELKEAITTVIKGKTYLAFDVAKTLQHAATSTTTKPIIGRREKDILALIAEGLTDGEIADKLILSVHTVHTYRKSLLSKLNAKNTAELVKIAFMEDLISFNKKNKL